MNEVHIDPNDLNTIVESYNKLIQNADKERDNFSKILLTIYTPVTSGLVFLSTSIKFEGDLGYEKLSFAMIVLSSVLIVFSTLVEKFSDILIANTVGETYTAHVRKTGKHLGQPMGGKPWQTFLIDIQTYLRPILLIINIASILWFAMLRIY